MEELIETELLIGNGFKSRGKGKLTSISPRYYDSGQREIRVTMELDIPAIFVPSAVPPYNKRIQTCYLEQQNFIHDVQCTVSNGASKLTTLFGQGGNFVGCKIPYLTLDGILNLEIVQYLEENRRGSNVELYFDLKFLLQQRSYYVIAQDGNVQSIENAVTERFSGRSTWSNVRIAASDWINEFLPGFRYDAPEFIRLPALSNNALYGSVREHLKRALDALHGSYASYRVVPGECFNAIDALAKSLGYKGYGDLPELSADMPERQNLLRKLQAYLHRWRHDQTGKGTTKESFPNIEYEEAMFIYVMTSYLLSLLGHITPQKGSE